MYLSGIWILAISLTATVASEDKHVLQQSLQGPPGAPGNNGIPGHNGQNGLNGEKGQKGDTGEPGVSGLFGQQDPPGKLGPRGETGEPRPTGPKGNPGECPCLQKSAFAPKLGKNYPPPEQPIIFNEVLYNDQHHFDLATGIFKLQGSGRYYFAYHVELYPNTTTILLMKNGKGIVGTYQTTLKAYENVSGSTILKLEKGDKVWLKAHQESNGATHTSYFLAYLIFES
ncbi:hibernation-associated plasma protein HP-20-like isoform X1 [Alligator sinensis]|uniref:Hibernation-associated plasma protein HP-20-like isoform X1 n=1 Tax=Alligator sinensis TaxID=38654 RepID=A0A1U7RYH7_ALLSI|nr:hibernation-associated plasma protein HP-20-like isoform X1 [Alligator sinensis]